MFLLVPAYPGCPGSKAVKRSLLLLFFFGKWKTNIFLADFALIFLIFDEFYR